MLLEKPQKTAQVLAPLGNPVEILVQSGLNLEVVVPWGVNWEMGGHQPLSAFLITHFKLFSMWSDHVDTRPKPQSHCRLPVPARPHTALNGMPTATPANPLLSPLLLSPAHTLFPASNTVPSLAAGVTSGATWPC